MFSNERSLVMSYTNIIPCSQQLSASELLNDQIHKKIRAMMANMVCDCLTVSKFHVSELGSLDHHFLSFHF